MTPETRTFWRWAAMCAASLWLTALIMFQRPPTFGAHVTMFCLLAVSSVVFDWWACRTQKRP